MKTSYSAERQAFIGWLSRSLGRPATLADINLDNLSMAIRQISGTSLAVAARFRRRMNELCEMLHCLGAIESVPDLPLPERPSGKALTREETRAVFDALRQQRGVIGKVQARYFWPALMAAAWDTGELPRALLHVRRDAFDLERMTATIDGNSFPLHPATVGLLRRLEMPGSVEMFAWPFDRSNLYLRFRRIMVESGLLFCQSGEFQRIAATAKQIGAGFHPLDSSKGAPKA